MTLKKSHYLIMRTRNTKKTFRKLRSKRGGDNSVTRKFNRLNDALKYGLRYNSPTINRKPKRFELALSHSRKVKDDTTMDLSKYMKLRSGKQVKKPIGGKNKTKKNRKHN